MARPALQDTQIEDFRERLCEAALRIFAEQGYGGVTLRGLAGEIGCSYATPYRYFRDKAEIFAAVRARAFERFTDFLERRLEGASDAEQRVRRLAGGYVEFALEHPQAFSVMFELEQPDAAAYPELRESEERSWKLLAGTVRDAVDSGLIAGSIHTLAHLFWAGIHGIVALHLAGKLTLGRTAAALVDPMTDALIAAHRAEGAPTHAGTR